MIKRTVLIVVLVALSLPPVVAHAQTPTPTPPGGLGAPILWLDAQAGVFEDAARTTEATDDGDPVGGWFDQSGNGNHASQSTGTAQPTLKLNIINGKRVIRFDGTEDFMSLTGMTNGVGNYTMFFAFGDSATNGEFLFDTNNGRLAVAHRSSNDTSKVGYYDTAWHDVADAENYSQVLTFRFEGTGSEIFRNGSSIGTDTYTQRAIGGPTILARYWASALHHFGGDMYEVLIYNTALSTADRETVENYLLDKYLPELLYTPTPSPTPTDTPSPTPTGTPAARFYVDDECDPITCSVYRQTPEPIGTVQWEHHESNSTGDRIDRCFQVCIYVSYPITFHHTTEADADGLDPDTFTQLKEGVAVLWEDQDDAGVCAAVGVDNSGEYGMSGIGSPPERKYAYYTYAIGGNGSYCDPPRGNLADVDMVIWLDDDFITPTPTGTPTETPTPGPTPTPSNTPQPATPTPRTIYIGQGRSAAGSDICMYDDDSMEFVNTLATVDASLATLEASVSTGDASVTISDDDPFSLAAGFILIMADMLWLQELASFFTFAFLAILTVQIIRFAIAGWGIVERVISLIKLLPFV